jgi:3-deoxy-D-manno-octulosonate 8-phosphate phosphatase (KDO 8-P phosphatase)|tara:strand:- start:431 stop:931 length:501 start_codon:yes stop_codon:yes gene_type:complete
MKKIKPKYFILDVDGVITDGQMTYDKHGKKYKVFGQDDHDSLKIIKKHVMVYFVSGDKIGFKISKKRVEDMGFKIKYLPVEIREKWLNENFGLKNCIYMGDGIFDHLIMKKAYYSIAPMGALNHVCQSANYVTKNKPAQRAVAEAVIHLLKAIYGINFLKIKNFRL